jgi:hypothetical protein
MKIEKEILDLLPMFDPKVNFKIQPDMITISGRVNEEKSRTTNRTVQEELELWHLKEDEAEENDETHQN